MRRARNGSERQPSLGRRRFLGAAGLMGVSAAGAALLACAGGGREGGAQTIPTVGTSGTVAAGEAPIAGGVFVTVEGGNPPTLDPHRTSSLFTTRSLSAALGRLLRFKSAPDPNVSGDWTTENELAAGVEAIDAGTWVAKLRPDIRFHSVAPVNGHPVEAEDVKATFTRALDPANPSRAFLDMIDPAHIETPDRQTVVFKLRYPYAPFRSLLASAATSGILPREALAGAYDPAKQVIGAGPFVLESYTPDVAWHFKKNSDWYDRGRPYLDGVKISILPDVNVQIAQFTSGNLDTITVTATDADQVQRDNPRAGLTIGRRSDGLIIFFQLGVPGIWQDIRVRRAISMAIDRQAMLKAVHNNRGRPQYVVPQYLGKWALSEEEIPQNVAQYLTYNLSEARKLMSAAGVSNIEVKIPEAKPNPGGVTLYTAIEMLPSFLAQIGIKASIVPIDYTRDWVGGGKGIRYGNFGTDTIVATFPEVYADVDQWLYFYYHSKSTGNTEKLSDPMIDSMIEKGRTILSDDERIKAYKEIQQYIVDRMYVVSGMPAGFYYRFHQPWVRNFSFAYGAGYGTEIYTTMWLTKR
jgi:peptide/nickel transport system substrate-binding protein